MTFIKKKLYRLYVHLRLGWLRIWYMGTKFTCPYCGHSFRRFIAGGSEEAVHKEKGIVGGFRENMFCPSCMSTDKERLVYAYLSKRGVFVPEGKTLSVLHIAPERNLGPKLSSNPRITYTSGDISSARSTTHRVDITDMQFEDVIFDISICSHVLEHVLDDAKAMREFYRTLKPGGFAILQVPTSTLKHTFEDPTVISFEEREKVFGQGDHVRIYATADYIAKLESVGFVVDVIKPFDFFGSEKSVCLALNPKELLFVASKK